MFLVSAPSWPLCMGSPRQRPMVPSLPLSLQLILRPLLWRKLSLWTWMTRHRPLPLGCRGPGTSYFPTWTRPTSASTSPNTTAFTLVLLIHGFPLEDAITTMRPHPMGADGLRVVRLQVGSKIGLNVHLNPFGRCRPTPLDCRRPIPTNPPDPTSRAPAPTSL